MNIVVVTSKLCLGPAGEDKNLKKEYVIWGWKGWDRSVNCCLVGCCMRGHGVGER